MANESLMDEDQFLDDASYAGLESDRDRYEVKKEGRRICICEFEFEFESSA